nr:hypothetical protein [Camelimonas fluminis]
MFSESIVDQQTDKIQIGEAEDGFLLTVWSLKCAKAMRFEPPAYNFAFISGDNRSVIDYSIDEQLGLKSLDGENVYIACASSEYLDAKVNSERTAFTLEPAEIDQIKRGVADVARKFLANYISEAVARKVSTAREVITENPQFLYMADGVEEFARTIQPNAFGKEEIFLEMSRQRWRRQKKFGSLGASIKEGKLGETLAEKIDEYSNYIADEKRGALAEYVVRRKAVLDVFEKLLENINPENDTYSKEDAIHQLFCPMRIDSAGLTIDDHNLWLLDDRLAFFSYFASDQLLSQYTTKPVAERPDLAFFYDTCVAWRESEATDTIVLVEFKRPMREDYSKGKDPVQQVLGYVKRRGFLVVGQPCVEFGDSPAIVDDLPGLHGPLGQPHVHHAQKWSGYTFGRVNEGLCPFIALLRFDLFGPFSQEVGDSFGVAVVAFWRITPFHGFIHERVACGAGLLLQLPFRLRKFSLHLCDNLELVPIGGGQVVGVKGVYQMGLADDLPQALRHLHHNPPLVAVLLQVRLVSGHGLASNAPQALAGVGSIPIGSPLVAQFGSPKQPLKTNKYKHFSAYVLRK